MPEMWAHCGLCSRWFFLPFSTGAEMVRSQCPVCAQPPERFEVRLDNAVFPVELTQDPVLI